MGRTRKTLEVRLGRMFVDHCAAIIGLWFRLLRSLPLRSIPIKVKHTPIADVRQAVRNRVSSGLTSLGHLLKLDLFRKELVMKAGTLLPLCFLASVAFASPIHVSGGGTFVVPSVHSDSIFTISFSGSDAVDSITLNADCGGGGFSLGFDGFGPAVSATPLHCAGAATIDGLDFHFGAPNGTDFSFAVGNGSGFALGENWALDQHAYVSLIGYVVFTSKSCVSGSGLGCTFAGSFVVLPTPKPGSIAFGLLGLGAIALRIVKKRIRTYLSSYSPRKAVPKIERNF